MHWARTGHGRQAAVGNFTTITSPPRWTAGLQDVLTAVHQLGRLHQETDDPRAARRILEEAYAVGRWRLGDADPLMLEISYDLGAVAEERRQALLQAIRSLRDDDRLVVAYRYFFDLSEAEMAGALGCARGTVKSRLSRALGRLREAVTSLGIAEADRREVADG